MPSKIVQRCGHCGNTTIFTIAAAGSHMNLVTTHTTTWTTYRVLLCSTCVQPMLERDVQEREEPHRAVPPARTKIPEVLYPIEQGDLTQSSFIPLSVQGWYREALKVEKVSPRACALMAGLALEEVCRVEQAQGSSLSERLNYLAQSERLPPTLAEMAQYVRRFRNMSAHAMDAEATEADIPILLYFVKAILEYVYMAPTMIKTLQSRIDGEVTPLP